MTKPKPPTLGDSALTTLFLHQILIQCFYVVYAHEDLTAALSGTERDSGGRVFFALQNILTAAANISKALWGQQASRSNERRHLRAILGVPENSAFRDVTMRNNFEHFDERLEKWWRQSSTLENFDPLEEFRYYEKDKSLLYFWGQTFDIQALIEEAQTMLPTLQQIFVGHLEKEWLKRDPATANSICQRAEIAPETGILPDEDISE